MCLIFVLLFTRNVIMCTVAHKSIWKHVEFFSNYAYVYGTFSNFINTVIESDYHDYILKLEIKVLQICVALSKIIYDI